MNSALLHVFFMLLVTTNLQTLSFTQIPSYDENASFTHIYNAYIFHFVFPY